MRYLVWKIKAKSKKRHVKDNALFKIWILKAFYSDKSRLE